ncbi:MAG: AtpZ/AtpI family protein [Planctomycetes bacterium]|nr:AtpZ/AtpI family protein [Planctomycetota bacterium]
MPRTKDNLDLAQGAYLGMTLAAALSLFAYAGYKLDQWLDSFPIGLIAGCLLGLAGGMAHVIRKVAQLQDQGRDGRPRQGQGDDRR